MKRIKLFCVIVGFSTGLFGRDSIPADVVSLFDKQLKAFPQEKIYLHTDKPYYISGETIWFRAHLADAVTHIPAAVSRYVYVELINPLDTVVTRIKVHHVDDVYGGNIPIPADLPEGDYVIRAYTNFMRSLDENYLHTKNIRIGDPQARLIRTDVQFFFATEKKITAEFRFSHPVLASAIVPEKIKISINSGRQINLKSDDGVASVSFNLSAESQKRVMLLEIEKDKHIYRQFVSIPPPDNDFDVSFYPEGGDLLEGVSQRVVFKALKSNGKSTEITGTIHDNNGEEITRIRSDYLGMGNFTLTSEEGKSYHAVCTNEKGASQRFDLPAARKTGYALAVNRIKNKLYVSLTKPASSSRRDTLYLLAHTRGMVLYIDRWNHEKEFVSFTNDFSPSGVVHLLLLDTRMHPISERLVFVNNADQASADFRPDKDNYAERSPVRAEVKLTDVNNEPLIGNFSVAVTDDCEVITDTCNNIQTSLLLTSDLRGYIENPAFYFRNNSVSSLWALDLLMLTQGWRRYDIAALTRGEFSRPTAAFEAGAEISGMVKGILSRKPVEGIEVSIFAMQAGYLDKTVTDKDGRFYFYNCDLPDSTHFILHADPKKGMKRMELIVDPETYPERTFPIVTPESVDRSVFARYADKAEQKYTYENGIRMINLSEVTITADRKPQRTSTYYSSADVSITEDQLEKFPATDMYTLLMRLPGVRVMGRTVSIRGGGDPLLLLDGVPMDIENLDMLSVHDVAQVDVLKNAGNVAIFGSRGSNGVIVVYTKDGTTTGSPKKQFNISIITPLGYRQPVEFYAPKYDTPKAKAIPDLRTTIHWQPNVDTDHEGKASFDFYTADSETTYTVVIEGITSDGKIIYQKGKVNRRAR